MAGGDRDDPQERFQLSHGSGSRTPRRRTSYGRWVLRLVLLGVILWMALQRGADERQMAGIGLAVIWALALPVILRLIWRATGRQSPGVRYALMAVTALLLLVAFALGVRPLIGF